MKRFVAATIWGTMATLGFSASAFAAPVQPTVSYGARGPAVQTLQSDLNSRAFSASPVDGIFGPLTATGLHGFENAAGLSVNNRINTATWNANDSRQPQTVSLSVGQRIDGRPVLAVYHMRATAYGPSRHDNYPYGATDYFGKPLAPGMVAVDPRVIPLKSTVYVAGYSDALLPSGGFLGKAVDTGNAIQGSRIDIYINGGIQAVSQFGIQPVTVYVLGK